MQSVEIRELNDSNLDEYLPLLSRRGSAGEEFYRWKYQRLARRNLSSGFLAYSEGACVGGIGFIPSRLVGISKERNTTWFADWYVMPEMHGQGIGKRLVERVRDVFPDGGFGSPAPDPARALAKKVGYNFKSDWFQLKVPIGSASRKNNPLRSKLRAVIDSAAVSLMFRGIEPGSLIKHNVIPDDWGHAAKRFLDDRIHFSRDAEVIDWMLRMPIDPNGWWWSFEYEETRAFGNVQTFNQRSVALVLDMFSSDREFWTSVGALIKTLRSEGVEELRLVLPKHVRTGTIPKRWTSIVQLISASSDLPEYLSLFDVESSWIALNQPR